MAFENEPDAFRETLAVEMADPHPIRLVQSAENGLDLRADLAASQDDLLVEVKAVDEFLHYKHQQPVG